MPKIEEIVQQAMSQPQPVTMSVMNDIQLVAWIASQHPTAKPAEAVAWATQIVIEAILQAGQIMKGVQARQQGNGIKPGR